MHKVKKNLTTILFICLMIISALFTTGCAKPPAEDINAAQSAVDETKQAGSEKYLPDDAKKLSDELSAALDEVKVQDAKFALFRKYEKAKEMLVSVRASSEKLKEATALKKEEIKKNTIALLEEAKSAVTNANTALQSAPAGKETQADIEAMKGDVKGMEDALPSVQTAIDSENFDEAANQAKAIKEKADGVSSQVQQAIAKIEEAKKAAEEARKMKKGKSGKTKK